ncbi:MAG: hypothetical protein AAF961_11955, partial [Planctomycetota bacterium]
METFHGLAILLAGPASVLSGAIVKQATPGEVLEQLPEGARVFVLGSSNEPAGLLAALAPMVGERALP